MISHGWYKVECIMVNKFYIIIKISYTIHTLSCVSYLCWNSECKNLEMRQNNRLSHCIIF